MISFGFRVVGVIVVSPAEQLLQLVSAAITVRVTSDGETWLLIFALSFVDRQSSGGSASWLTSFCTANNTGLLKHS